MATVRKIFDLAGAILFTKFREDIDCDAFSPMLLESLMVIALPYENLIRRRKGKAPLETSPEILQIDNTEIDWDDRITRLALPCGLASRLLAGEPGMKAEAVIEYNRFIEALKDTQSAYESDTGKWEG